MRSESSGDRRAARTRRRGTESRPTSARYDPESKTLSIALAPRPVRARTTVLESRIALHFDGGGELTEIELLGITPAPAEWFGGGPDALERVRRYQAAMIAAVHKARAHHRDGRRLFRLGSWGPAAALAVLGYEEAGKIVAYHLLSLGQVKEEAVDGLLSLLSRNHKTKQALAYVAKLVGDVARRVRPIVESTRFPRKPTIENLREVMTATVTDIVRTVSSHVAPERVESDMHSIMEGRALEELKHRGFYADLDLHAAAGVPEPVTRKEADEMLSRLWWTLRGISMLMPIAHLAPEGLALIRGWIQDPQLTAKIRQAAG